MRFKPALNVKEFFQDFASFFSFLKKYFNKRFFQAFYRFEGAKGFLVDGLVIKRGKYIRPFLHSSMSGLFLIGLMLAPLIKTAFSQNDFETEGSQPMVLGVSTVEGSTTTQISVKPRDSVVSYSIKPGDTISTIAQKFAVSEETILWQNNLKKDDVIAIGQKIEIPPVTGMVHKVKRGETIYSIAKKYTVEAQNIVNWPFNTFSNDETFELAVGQLLIIPDGIKPKEALPKQYIARQQTPSAGVVSATGSFAWPAAGNLTQYFRWYHPAIDIANASAPNILAADAGQVILVKSQAYAYGNHVIVSHGNGFTTLYAHMTSIYVTQGQTVNRGDALGSMGCTGRCSGTHLHFEIRLNGAAQNPLNYLK
ncbi:peptidoglycan DD-metalloendopeptidase family protein [Patescibacteria group bacterium]